MPWLHIWACLPATSVNREGPRDPTQLPEHVAILLPTKMPAQGRARSSPEEVDAGHCWRDCPQAGAHGELRNIPRRCCGRIQPCLPPDTHTKKSFVALDTLYKTSAWFRNSELPSLRSSCRGCVRCTDVNIKHEREFCRAGKAHTRVLIIQAHQA